MSVKSSSLPWHKEELTFDSIETLLSGMSTDETRIKAGR